MTDEVLTPDPAKMKLRFSGTVAGINYVTCTYSERDIVASAKVRAYSKQEQKAIDEAKTEAYRRLCLLRQSS